MGGIVWVSVRVSVTVVWVWVWVEKKSIIFSLKSRYLQSHAYPYPRDN